MNVLIACEESQTICKAFRERGHNAFSCDIQPCSGGHPAWHFQDDALSVIKNVGGNLETGEVLFVKKWDLLIAHPPCTYLTVTGLRWFYHPEDAHLPVEQRREHPNHIGRRLRREEAIAFFLEFTKTNVERWAIENPVGCMSTIYKKPTQIIHPYMFGEKASKKTCLWLHNLPPLKPTKIVDKGEQVTYKSGRIMPKWYVEVANLPPAERRKARSKTFQGIADAIAEQWSNPKYPKQIELFFEE